MNIVNYIEETNKEFESASPEKKRVMIAQDVIKRMEWQNLVASSGKVLGGEEVWKQHSDTSLKDIVNSGVECEVCGKGALLCSYVGRVNKFTFGDIDEEDNIHSPEAKYHTKLAEIFSLEQIDLIETAFEGYSYIAVNKNDLEIEKAEEFCKEYYYDEDKLKAIMLNIISNNGEFRP